MPRVTKKGGDEKLPKNIKANKIDPMIKTPPIVGVPAFLKWSFGPSSLITWPNCFLCINSIKNFPTIKENITENKNARKDLTVI